MHCTNGAVFVHLAENGPFKVAQLDGGKAPQAQSAVGKCLRDREILPHPDAVRVAGVQGGMGVFLSEPLPAPEHHDGLGERVRAALCGIEVDEGASGGLWCGHPQAASFAGYAAEELEPAFATVFRKHPFLRLAPEHS